MPDRARRQRPPSAGVLDSSHPRPGDLLASPGRPGSSRISTSTISTSCITCSTSSTLTATPADGCSMSVVGPASIWCASSGAARRFRYRPRGVGDRAGPREPAPPVAAASCRSATARGCRSKTAPSTLSTRTASCSTRPTTVPWSTNAGGCSRPAARRFFQVYNRISWLNALSRVMKVGLEHQDAPVIRKYSPGEFRALLDGFSSVRIVYERFPVMSRLHGGWKGASTTGSSSGPSTPSRGLSCGDSAGTCWRSAGSSACGSG